jgi:hypothetical protein
MTLTALPTFYDLTDPTSNLAADPCSDPLGNLAALMSPGGYGLEADRLVIPAFIEENRIAWLERWAMPLFVGTSQWFFTRRPVRTALWTLAAYMAPYPMAIYLAATTALGATMSERRKEGGLGEHRFRPTARRTLGRKRRCIEFRRRRGRTVCVKYAMR